MVTGYERDFYQHVSQIMKILAEGGKSVSVMAEQIVFVRQKLDKQNELLDKIVTRLERIAENH
jgi:hypothetical protein